MARDEAPQRTQAPHTLLIVDDERSLRFSIGEWARDAGYRALEAEDGGTALDHVREQSVDAVLLDLRLGTEDGLEVLGQSVALCGLHAAFPGLGATGVGGPYLASLLVAFALFRLLDILKPGPIGALERLPGGLGIMADDLLAGLLVAAAFVLAGALGAGRLLS